MYNQPKILLESHICLIGQADIFIDTLTYNAHSTAVELLWSGVPILSVAGRRMAGRVAASVLLANDAGVTVARTPLDLQVAVITCTAKRMTTGK